MSDHDEFDGVTVAESTLAQEVVLRPPEVHVGVDLAGDPFVLEYRQPDWWIMARKEGGGYRRQANVGRDAEAALVALQKYQDTAG